MRRYVFISMILIIAFTIIMGTYNSCLANKYDITSGDFKNEWNPTAKNQGKFVTEGAKPITNLIVFITNKILGIIQLFSGMLMVLCITYTGFNMILGVRPEVADEIGLTLRGGNSPSVRKRVQNNIRRILIGSFFAFSSTTIVKIAFSVLTSF